MLKGRDRGRGTTESQETACLPELVTQLCHWAGSNEGGDENSDACSPIFWNDNNVIFQLSWIHCWVQILCKQVHSPFPRSSTTWFQFKHLSYHTNTHASDVLASTNRRCHLQRVVSAIDICSQLLSLSSNWLWQYHKTGYGSRVLASRLLQRYSGWNNPTKPNQSNESACNSDTCCNPYKFKYRNNNNKL